MKSLEETFDKQVNEILKPARVLTELFAKRLREIGIELNKDQLEKLKSNFCKLEDGAFTFEIEDDQVFKAGFKDEKKLREVIANIINNLGADLERFEKDLIERIPSTCSSVLGEITEIIYKRLMKASKQYLKYHNEVTSEFNKNLKKRWGKALNLLEMLIMICFEAGESFNNEFRKIAVENNDYVFEILVRLHARSCQIASEILTLLKSGHADGAHARWRSLHEIVVVGYFIESNDNKLAERYLSHDVVECFKAAKIYNEYCKELGYEPLTKDEMMAMEIEYNNLITKFGSSFKNEYGWASSVIGMEKPTFRDIEKVVGLDHIRPYYKMACFNVHANPRGIFFKLGLYPESGDLLLAGPSNVGLEEPGYLTAISLAQITSNLLEKNSNLDTAVVCNVISKIVDEISEAFLNAEQLLREEGVEGQSFI